MVYNPASQWERYGATDPYYGVLSEPEFRAGRLDEQARARFFASGRRQVAELWETLQELAGAGLEHGAALDYGCGVGRLTLPLAERCARVYGVDVSPSMLREAARNAARINVRNVRWLPASALGELHGQYHMVQSWLVLQHIPVREGERVFAALLAGLRPGGVGSIQVALRPTHPAAGAYHWTIKTVPLAYNLANLARGRPLRYPHMQMNHYSLERLGRLLADAGVAEWRVRFLIGLGRMSHHSAVILFRKPL